MLLQPTSKFDYRVHRSFYSALRGCMTTLTLPLSGYSGDVIRSWLRNSTPSTSYNIHKNLQCLPLLSAVPWKRQGQRPPYPVEKLYGSVFPKCLGQKRWPSLFLLVCPGLSQDTKRKHLLCDPNICITVVPSSFTDSWEQSGSSPLAYASVYRHGIVWPNILQ